MSQLGKITTVPCACQLQSIFLITDLSWLSITINDCAVSLHLYRAMLIVAVQQFGKTRHTCTNEKRQFDLSLTLTS